MGTPATVGVNDDLTTGKTSVTLWATDDEAARGLDLRAVTSEETRDAMLRETYVVDGALIEKLLRDHLRDDLLPDGLPEVLSRDLLSMLSGDDYGVDTEGNRSAALLPVLNSDLRLGVRKKPGKSTGTARLRHRGIQAVGENESERHVLRCLVCRISEHDTLVTGTDALERAVVETLRDIRRLLLDSNEDVAGLVIEALRGVIIANLLDRVPNDLLVVDLRLGGNFTKDHDHTGLGGGLASDLGERVLSQAGIELKNNIRRRRRPSACARRTMASETWSQILSVSLTLDLYTIH